MKLKLHNKIFMRICNLIWLAGSCALSCCRTEPSEISRWNLVCCMCQSQTSMCLWVMLTYNTHQTFDISTNLIRRIFYFCERDERQFKRFNDVVLPLLRFMFQFSSVPVSLSAYDIKTCYIACDCKVYKF